MLLKDEEVTARLESPNNLLNRLNRVTARNDNPMSIFRPSACDDVSSAVLSGESIETDDIDKLVEDNAKKIKMGIVKARALDVLHDALGELGNRLGETAKVRDLATIAKDMNSILTAEDSKKNNINQQVVIYKPVVNDISKYETLVVNE